MKWTESAVYEELVKIKDRLSADPDLEAKQELTHVFALYYFRIGEYGKMFRAG